MRFILFIFIGLKFCLAQEFEITFYYVSSQTETYIPLTEKMLKDEPMYHGVIKGLAAEYLFEMAKTPLKKLAFDSQSPRLLLYASGVEKPIVIDRYAVAKQGDLEYFVNPNIFSYLESGLHRGRIPHKRDYTHEQWQALHDMHQRVPDMVDPSYSNSVHMERVPDEDKVSQSNSVDALTVFLGGVLAVIFIFILIFNNFKINKK
jgi:hypothetical protein